MDFIESPEKRKDMIELVPDIKLGIEQDLYDQSSEPKQYYRLIQKADLVLRDPEKCRQLKSRPKQSENDRVTNRKDTVLAQMTQTVTVFPMIGKLPFLMPLDV